MAEETTAPWTDRIAVFDLETTGVDVEEARIVTAFVGVLNAHGELEAQQSWLANPGVPIPEAATAVHGVTTERAIAEGSPAQQVIHEIMFRIGTVQSFGIGVVAFNAAFDFTVLNREAQRYGLTPLNAPMPVIDPLVIDKQVDRFRKGKRTLGITCEHYGISLDDWHEASADAIAAGRLSQAMAVAHPQLLIPVAELHAQTATWADEQSASFAEWMRKKEPGFVAERGWPVRDAPTQR